MDRFVVWLGVLGALRGGLGVFLSGWEVFLWPRVPIPVAYTIQAGVWIVLYLWLMVFCVFGLARLHRKRGTSAFGPAFNRFVLRLLVFLSLSFAAGLAMGVGHALRLL